MSQLSRYFWPENICRQLHLVDDNSLTRGREDKSWKVPEEKVSIFQWLKWRHFKETFFYLGMAWTRVLFDILQHFIQRPLCGKYKREILPLTKQLVERYWFRSNECFRRIISKKLITSAVDNLILWMSSQEFGHELWIFMKWMRIKWFIW